MTSDAGTIGEHLTRIRERHHLEAAFPPDVEQAAAEASRSDWRAGRRDLTDVEFVTLDPERSVDLDQAFAVRSDGDVIVLSYAIADVAAFAPAGGAVEAEAWERAVTVYLPDGRVPVYPTVLSERSASLLPDGDRPAVVFEVAVDVDGMPLLRSAERAIVRSRGKLAYETTEPSDLDPIAVELYRRSRAAEERRGATKIDWPEQDVVLDANDPLGVNLVLRPLRECEEINAAMSLAANLAIADLQRARGSGLFRVMPEPDRFRERSLRRMACALGVDWPKDEPFRSVVASLDPANPGHRQLLVEARRVGRGASYALFDPDETPWHSAMAATYAHATAPMRRLADRYVIEHVLWLLDPSLSKPAESPVADALIRLPKTMAQAEQRAAAVDRSVVDLVEAIELRDMVGRTFPARAIEVSRDGVVVQLTEPPVRARIRDVDGNPSATVADDDEVTVRLTSVDVAAASVRFEIVSAPTKTVSVQSNAP